ncbi:MULTISPECIES: fasciclin domain-containing protein [Polymorphospora]|uniref:Fasciclin domain-containing protein n=1 Tax=Polymorphospora lycopeni TaxID=3140240 RepID=A0ABV5CX88_9ACTN
MTSSARRPGRPTRSPRHPRDRGLAVRARGVAASLLCLVVLAGCTGKGDDSAAGSTAPASPIVTGPLCEVLPTGTEPGNPASLTGEPVDVALQWITVLTAFEAAVRASGLATDLRGMEGLTILAPTDDAFLRKFSAANWDELILSRPDDLRALLRAHLIDGAHSLADLVTAGNITTLDGTEATVAADGAMARIAGDAQTLCVDYRATNARIHVIDKVLGDLPTTAHEDDHIGH